MICLPYLLFNHPYPFYFRFPFNTLVKLVASLLSETSNTFINLTGQDQSTKNILMSHYIKEYVQILNLMMAEFSM